MFTAILLLVLTTSGQAIASAKHKTPFASEKDCKQFVAEALAVADPMAKKHLGPQYHVAGVCVIEGRTA